MDKIKLILTIAMFLLTATAYSAEASKFRVYISNQSFIKPQERITLVVNGKELYNKVLPVKNQHYYESFSVDCTNDIKQWISVVANDTNESAVLGVDSNDIKNEIWISIEYWYDEDSKRGYFRFVTGHGRFLID